MAIITRLNTGRDRSKKVRVFLDGKYAFSLEARVAADNHLKVSQELSPTQIEALARADQRQRCLAAANRLFAYRPRSEEELKQKLSRHGFDAETVKTALAALKERGLLDDAEFARFWKENRQSFSPRSQHFTALELRQKGVNPSLIAEVVGDIDDAESAFQAGLKKASRLDIDDYQAFCHKVGEYLRRRGFGYPVIKQTINRLWGERGGSEEKMSS